MKRSISAAALALVLLAFLGLARPVAADELVPFHGSFDGTVERSGAPPVVSVLVEGTGQAAHLGQFTLAIPHQVVLATRTASGTYEFTAANGDTLTAEFIGHSEPIPGTPFLYIVETATITGGTGRFAGATGSFTTERLYDTAAGTTTGSFDGAISSPGSAKH